MRASTPRLLELRTVGVAHAPLEVAAAIAILHTVHVAEARVLLVTREFDLDALAARRWRAPRALRRCCLPS